MARNLLRNRLRTRRRNDALLQRLRSEPPPRAAANDLDAIAPKITTVRVWIDDKSGLLQRVFVEQRSTRDVAKHTWLGRHDITLMYGDVSPVAAPEQATDVTLDQWCTRARNVAWCG